MNMKWKITAFVFLICAIPGAIAAWAYSPPTKSQARIETPEQISLTNEHVLEAIVKTQKSIDAVNVYLGKVAKTQNQNNILIFARLKAVTKNQTRLGWSQSRIEKLLKRKAKPRRRYKRNKYCGPRCKKRRVVKRKARTNWGSKT